ncbi:MAG: type II toxin-antitoxin system RelE/ParE family toxin [Rhizobacter sp.]|nr:type II toxin-antitoxin system RelE/ParE family toxin [Rhizobacter sp.]
MLFVETPYFTRFCEEHCTDDELRRLQQVLLERPDAGDLIRGARGLRKLRWAMPGRGKRSGARVIYYWRSAAGQIYLLHAYAKSAQSDLSDAQRKQLIQWVNEVLGDE